MPVPPVSTFPSVLPRVEHRAELAERRTRKRTISATCGPRSQWGAPYLGRSHSKSAQELCTSNHPVPNSHVSPYQSRRQTLSLLDAPKGPFISTAPKSRYNPRQNNPIRRKVYFYHKYDPHYSFTNFSPHPVMYKGNINPTRELPPRISEDNWINQAHKDMFEETQRCILSRLAASNPTYGLTGQDVNIVKVTNFNYKDRP
ncbi:hypothetical protein K435DRAFT_853977 [Dendrothele bispora CBS 962.96]|uniref:Uncharacterized protein n=1 Tax=Dendrothele bispora (strain CBS 962.96) TaxID=1314807 RepID=A0A4S8MF63_DENBC|nr:hypothetical protein K435DRAFT_853977 [Dendrothele bispora CBS 962.96]